QRAASPSRKILQFITVGLTASNRQYKIVVLILGAFGPALSKLRFDGEAALCAFALLHSLRLKIIEYKWIVFSRVVTIRMLLRLTIQSSCDFL
ncbi:MAG: hypothetical protein KDK62_06035, partial [Chlamydiia bacterium]|nr:hypothetical protein [Chlamydiia bacterium]